MYLFGILKIALGVPEGTEGFRFGAEFHVEGDACGTPGVRGTSAPSGDALTGLPRLWERGKVPGATQRGLVGRAKGISQSRASSHQTLSVLHCYLRHGVRERRREVGKCWGEAKVSHPCCGLSGSLLNSSRPESISRREMLSFGR